MSAGPHSSAGESPASDRSSGFAAEGASPRKPRYGAFISYSHAQSQELARELQKWLQSYAKPWYRWRAVNVFRDETDLAAAPALWSKIAAALDDSSHFILLASPQAARSKWVKREVRYWLGDRNAYELEGVALDAPMSGTRPQRAATLLIALIDGDIAWREEAHDFDWHATSALPHVLSGVFQEEPRWIDLRPIVRRDDPRQRLSRRSTAFMQAVAQISAPIRGITDFSRLVSEDYRQHKRAIRTAWAAVFALLLLASTAAWQWHAAQRQQQLGEVRRIAGALRQQHNDKHYTTPSGLVSALAAAASLTALDHPSEAFSLLKSIPSPLPRLKDVVALPGGFGDVIAMPDGSRILMAGRDGTLIIWDLQASKQIVGFKERSGIRQLVASADGRHLLLLLDDGTASLWDPQTGQRERAFDLPSRLAALSADGEFVALARGDGVDILSAATGERLAHVDDRSKVNHLVFLPGGHEFAVVYSVGEDGDYRFNLYRVPGGSEVTLAVPECLGSQRTYALDPFGRHLASGCDAGAYSDPYAASCTVRVCAVPSMHLLFKVPSQHKVDLAFSADGRLLAVEENNEVQVWNVADKRLLASYAPGQNLRQILLGAEDHLGMRGVGIVWIANIGTQAYSMILPAAGEAEMVAVAANGLRLALADRQRGELQVWEAQAINEPIRFGYQGAALRFKFSPDGHYLGAVGLESRGSDLEVTRLWDAQTGALIEEADADAENEEKWRRVADLLQQELDAELVDANPREATSQNGRWLGTVSVGAVQVRDAKSRAVLAEISVNGPPRQIAFTPDGTRLAIANGRFIELWKWKPEDLRVEICELLRTNLGAPEWQSELERSGWRAQCPQP